MILVDNLTLGLSVIGIQLILRGNWNGGLGGVEGGDRGWREVVVMLVVLG